MMNALALVMMFVLSLALGLLGGRVILATVFHLMMRFASVPAAESAPRTADVTILPVPLTN